VRSLPSGTKTIRPSTVTRRSVYEDNPADETEAEHAVHIQGFRRGSDGRPTASPLFKKRAWIAGAQRMFQIRFGADLGTSTGILA